MTGLAGARSESRPTSGRADVRARRNRRHRAARRRRRPARGAARGHRDAAADVDGDRVRAAGGHGEGDRNSRRRHHSLPLVGEGRGGGAARFRDQSHPPPLPSPERGEGTIVAALAPLADVQASMREPGLIDEFDIALADKLGAGGPSALAAKLADKASRMLGERSGQPAQASPNCCLLRRQRPERADAARTVAAIASLPGVLADVSALRRCSTTLGRPPTNNSSGSE